MAKKKKLDAHTRAIVRRSLAEQIEAKIARCEWLRDQGRLDEARRLLVRIEKLATELKSLE